MMQNDFTPYKPRKICQSPRRPVKGDPVFHYQWPDKGRRNGGLSGGRMRAKSGKVGY